MDTSNALMYYIVQQHRQIYHELNVTIQDFDFPTEDIMDSIS